MPGDTLTENGNFSCEKNVDSRLAAVPNEVGIIAIELYIPNYYVDQTELEKFDGVSAGKYTIGLGQKQMGFVGDNEDVNSLGLTVVSRLFQRQGFSARDFGRVEVGTESMLDRSKGVKTVLMQLFEEVNSEIEGIDSVTACYGGTAALFNAIHWVESSWWDGRLALVVAADIAIYAEGSARCTGGAGAIAIVIGPNAPLVVDRGLRGTHMRHVYDFYKPQLDSEYPQVDGALSIECYLSSLDICYERYKRNKNRTRASLGKLGLSPVVDTTSTTEVGDACVAVNLESFDAIMFHTPFSKIVQKSLGRLLLSDYIAEMPHSKSKPMYQKLNSFQDVSLSTSYHNKALEKVLLEISETLFNEKTLPSLSIAQRVGNMYTPSLYACLVSYLTSKPNGAADLLGNKIAMFSYGSGMAATMYSITVTKDLNKIDHLITPLLNVKSVLDNRMKFTPQQYVEMLRHRENVHNMSNFTPFSTNHNLQSHTYYLVNVDAKFRRKYECFVKES